jgi:hypothetical protein
MANVESNVVAPYEKVVSEKVYKTKDYVRRAHQKYANKKYSSDVDYREKRLESSKKSHQKNPEKYREYSRIYMREYRAKKKLEKANTVINPNDDVDLKSDKSGDDMTTTFSEIKI